MMLFFIALNGNPGGLSEFQQLTADGLTCLRRIHKCPRQALAEPGCAWPGCARPGWLGSACQSRRGPAGRLSPAGESCPGFLRIPGPGAAAGCRAQFANFPRAVPCVRRSHAGVSRSIAARPDDLHGPGPQPPEGDGRRGTAGRSVHARRSAQCLRPDLSGRLRPVQPHRPRDQVVISDPPHDDQLELHRALGGARAGS